MGADMPRLPCRRRHSCQFILAALSSPGSYFGDLLLSTSTSALLRQRSLTGTDIACNLGGMVKTSLVPFVSVALYALLGPRSARQL